MKNQLSLFIWVFLAPLFFALIACSSKSLQSEKNAAEQIPQTATKALPSISGKTSRSHEVEPSEIDAFAIQSSLGMDRAESALGYSEKTFDTCQVGYGFSKNQDCSKKHFVVIHFQLMCRDSDGTTSVIVTQDSLQPISRRSFNWSLKNLSGISQTDSDGYGQIRAIASTSPIQQRLKLTIGNDFLFLKAGEINRVITPLSWCSDRTAGQ